jgi:hypothetical protein
MGPEVFPVAQIGPLEGADAGLLEITVRRDHRHLHDRIGGKTLADRPDDRVDVAPGGVFVTDVAQRQIDAADGGFGMGGDGIRELHRAQVDLSQRFGMQMLVEGVDAPQ